jgi:formylmethanofuran dehydrogenase subunit E
MNDFKILLEQARLYHGELCAGIVLGTRMTIIGLNALGFSPMKRNRDLIVFAEIDRCMTDAIQAITGCSLGRRTLKFVDYGKFGATFCDVSTGRSVRISTLINPRDIVEEKGMEGAVDLLSHIPELELLRMQKVKVDLPAKDKPGKAKMGGQPECTDCGEYIFDNREVIIGGRLLCKSCVHNSYYRPVEDTE